VKPRFFATPEKFRAWLQTNHARKPELLVGFYKKAGGRQSIDWPQSVDEALCFGWIDGIRRSLGEDSYTIRFTPRRPGSIWSSVNIRRVAWGYFSVLAPSYRHKALYWITSSRKPETRRSRLDRLIGMAAKKQKR
jgi:uncharacterized protein YdeI (YjbR/CyaY-like superfamily)